MSLFENSEYRWRETFFILFRLENRPQAEDVKALFDTFSDRCQPGKVIADLEGRFESVTIIAPDDFAGLDVTFITGEDVADQVGEFLADFQPLGKEEMQQAAAIAECNARYDIYHFEHSSAEEDEGEMLDPGALLLVLEGLAKLCQGNIIDPQSGGFM